MAHATDDPPPTTAPSTQASPQVAALLQRIDAAYSHLQSAQFGGHLIGHYDIAGQKSDRDVAFTSSYAAPNRFRHETKSDVVIVSTGEKVYWFEPSRNSYGMNDAPTGRAALAEWPHVVAVMLPYQNPSLLLALTPSASAGLSDLARDMTRQPDTTIDGVAYPTLAFDLPTKEHVTMLVDPSTSLLRQVRFDSRQMLEEKRGATDVKQAEFIVDYTSASPVAIAADDARFKWTPPAGAVLASADTGPGAGDAGSASAMIGKPAADFSLKGLDDKPVTMASLKGSVVVLDFWATWCGPCVAALPHLDALYREQSPHGLKLFAVDFMEDADTVKPFVQEKKLSMPVLLDTAGDVGKNYGAADGIPVTVIIGKDGLVKKVFLGASDEIEQQIKDIVVKEMGT
ncbi:MAG TPA: redoxin domain-containing protein [Tepidisphaeraceae bacterium]|nr:redoxin domain-containing protein [Tepidisphaeraceae bacterium]